MVIEYSNGKEGVITDNALEVLKSRYFLKDADNNIIENFHGLCNRVATAIGGNEDERRAFFQLMYSLDFLPNTPTLVNAGTDKGTLSACFVLPVGDSMEEITKASHDQAMVQKFGGGTGFGLTMIRPKGSPVKTTHGIAMGPVGVLEYLSATSKMVTEGGIRDGANMAVLSVHHPDIMEFIRCKTIEGRIHNFNISVGITKEFMQALQNDTHYALYVRPDDSGDFDKGKMVGTKSAREVWDAIIEGAWRNGEPGAIFIDEVNERHPADFVGEIIATNPCGEQPLLANESCNLGSINVSNFIAEEGVMGYAWDQRKKGRFDWDRFGLAVRAAVRFLDRTIDANKYATKDVEWANKYTRKIGLGIMGFADALVKLGISYGDKDSLAFAQLLSKTMWEFAEDESRILGDERGVFPAYNDYVDMLEEHPTGPRRNACLTTIAPTGSISMIASCSSGIEPLFALAWRKQNILHGKTLEYVHPMFEEYETEDVIEDVINGESLQTHRGSSENARHLFVTTVDIAPEDHVYMQAAFQKYVDAAVSKTINLPNSATIEDVDKAYRLAYKTKCKGITVYRAGSREREVLVSNADIDDDSPGFEIPQEENWNALTGKTVRVMTGRGKVYITLNKEGGQLKEVFLVHGKAGGNDSAMAEALSRMISISLQGGILPARIIKQLRDIIDTPVWSEGKKILSLPDAVAQVMADEIGFDFGTSDASADYPDKFEMEAKCPECNAYAVRFEEGCCKCYACGFSEC